MPLSLSISYGRPIAMTMPHFKVAKGSKGVTTSLFCLNNRMPKKTLICHLFTRTVKWCVDPELFVVKMQKNAKFPPHWQIGLSPGWQVQQREGWKIFLSSPFLSFLSVLLPSSPQTHPAEPCQDFLKSGDYGEQPKNLFWKSGNPFLTFLCGKL